MNYYDEEGPVDARSEDSRGRMTRALDQQQKALEVVAATIHDLQSSLSQVLQPERSELSEVVPREQNALVEPMSPVLQQITATNRRLEGFAEKLQNLANRVER